MFIIAISLSGFKSFAERTEFTVSDGLTVIVGPNGCGKSNIIEAVRWVMGEGSAKRLRGAEMEDVIFAGTPQRRRRQSAEVKITLDNQQGKAPAPFHDAPELVVSRRIERGQGSVYRINNAEVRARDVQMLFADLSIGSRSASIISQGEIEALVESKPDGRRLLLEEAAGVRGLHTRRRESELKLAQAENNLQRLEDILEHTETELHSLQKQARETQRYRELMANLRTQQALHWWVQDRDHHQVYTEAKSTFLACQNQYQQAVQVGNALSIRVARLENEVTVARTDDERAKVKSQDCRDFLREQERAQEISLANIQRDTEREADWRAELVRIEENLALWQGRLEDLQQRITKVETYSSADLDRLHKAYLACLDSIEKIKIQCDKDIDAAAEMNRTLMQHTAERDALQRELTALISESERLDKTITESEQLLVKSAHKNPDIASKETDWAEIRDRAESALQECYIQWSAIREQPQLLKDLRLQHEMLERQMRLLEEEEQQTGKSWKEWQESHTQGLPAAWSAPKGLEKAVSAALGMGLWAGQQPQAGFYWLTQTQPYKAPHFPESVRSLWDVIDAACTPLPHQWERIILPLRWTGLVIQDADIEVFLPELQPGQMLVRPDGIGVRWDGLAWGNAADSSQEKGWKLGNELESLQGQLAKARYACSESSQRYQQAFQEWQQKLDSVEAHYRAAQQAREKAHQDWVEAERERVQQQRVHAQSQQRRQQLEITLAAAKQSKQAVTERLHVARDSLSLVECTIEQLSQQPPDPKVDKRAKRLEVLQAELQQVHHAWISAQAVQENARIAEEQQRAELAHAEGIIQQDSHRQQEFLDKLAELKTNQRQRQHTIDIAQNAVKDAEAAWHRQDQLRQQKADKLRELLHMQQALGNENHTHTQAIAQYKEALIRAEAECMHRKEGLQKLRQLAQQATSERMEDLPKRFAFDDAMLCQTQEEVKAAVAVCERRIQSLGEVNLRADIDAEAKRKELENSRAEAEDVCDAIIRLREAIAEINQQGIIRLKETFSQLNTLFSEYFQRLFSGGDARLIWIDGDDPLSPGIDIRARPPGKAVQSVYLLSGGEKSLTALAMIAAVLRLCPTPICLLDEVDAALDDANVARFCGLLSELSRGKKKMRFIIITHHRLSMAKADNLLGVGMPERGISRLYAVDLLSYSASSD